MANIEEVGGGRWAMLYGGQGQVLSKKFFHVVEKGNRKLIAELVRELCNEAYWQGHEQGFKVAKVVD